MVWGEVCLCLWVWAWAWACVGPHGCHSLSLSWAERLPVSSRVALSFCPKGGLVRGPSIAPSSAGVCGAVWFPLFPVPLRKIRLWRASDGDKCPRRLRLKLQSQNAQCGHEIRAL